MTAEKETVFDPNTCIYMRDGYCQHPNVFVCKSTNCKETCDKYELKEDCTYPCIYCSDLEKCSKNPDDNCKRYRIWIDSVNAGKYQDKMCPNFKTCFLSVYTGFDMAPSIMDCTGTYAEYTWRCMDEEEVD